MNPEDRKTGRVRAVNYQKGFGFARSKGEDYFFHMTSFQDEEEFFDLKPACKIEFTAREAKNGKIQAMDITIIRGKE